MGGAQSITQRGGQFGGPSHLVPWGIPPLGPSGYATTLFSSISIPLSTSPQHFLFPTSLSNPRKRRSRRGGRVLSPLPSPGRSPDSLGGLLDRAVGVEGLQLVLHPTQAVRQLAVVQGQDGLLDPLQKVGGQRLVLLDQLVGLDGVVQDLGRGGGGFNGVYSRVGSPRTALPERKGKGPSATLCDSGPCSGYLPDPFPFHGQGLHLGEVVVVRGHVSDDGLLVGLVHVHV